ncbi:integrase [Bradyrhizobium sp. USDA 4448]
MKGSIKQRSEGSYSLIIDLPRERGEKRKQKWITFRGTKRGAEKELARLLTEMEAGQYVEASKLTVGRWIDQWIEAGAPGRRRKKVSQRTLERYGQLLRTHVKPVLDNRRLQKLRAPEIDKLYAEMADAKFISPRTQHHVHTVLSACLATAHRKGLTSTNPMQRVEQIPAPENFDPDEETDEIGEGLTETELTALIAGFKSSGIYPVVVLAAASGARRNELLALRWSDLDADKKTLRIERALEQTKKFGIRIKPPKTKRGFRTIDLDDATIAVLLKEKERHLRLAAGIPDGAAVDLSLVRLPDGALMFPAISVSFTAPRHPRNFSRDFADRVDLLREQARQADLPSFSRIRFHDLRGIHSTALLDAGIPVHTVAQRIGDDPAVLLRNYTKRKRSTQANEKLSEIITGLAAGFLAIR